jgi:hypothetical protein
MADQYSQTGRAGLTRLDSKEILSTESFWEQGPGSAPLDAGGKHRFVRRDPAVTLKPETEAESNTRICMSQLFSFRWTSVRMGG